MSFQLTINRLRDLRLAHMAEAYALQQQQPKLHELSFDDRFALLVEREASERESKKLNRLIRAAGFPEKASLEDADYRPTRGLEKSLIATLASGEWVRQRLNLIVSGPTGVGKTWLACAFGTQMCRMGLPTMFVKASDLYEGVGTAILDGSLATLKARLVKPNLLVLDDFGLGEITPQAAQVLLDVIDHRMRTGSLLITSQFPTDQWHSFFPDPTLADAVLDRVVHQAHRVSLKGESMRKLKAKKLMTS